MKVNARWLLLAVALIALNLRPFMAGIGPLAADIGRHTGLGLRGLALLTLVPMLLMGVFAFAGPWLQGRFGARRAVVAALILLAVGSALRLFTHSGWQLVGTAAVLGLGAAVVQALLPGIVKRQFPRHVGVVMGLYSAMLMGGGALGAQVAPLAAAAGGDWHWGLAWMAVPALLAVALAARSLPPDAPDHQNSLAVTAYLRRPRVWLLMLCFGLVNGGYSTVVAWLAPFYQEHGWSAAGSGTLLAVLALSQALAALGLPMLAGRHKDRRPWLWFTLALQAIGFAALALWPDAAPLAWVVLLGAGLGGCFALSLIVALEHLPDPGQAGALSALMQGGGFLIAASPPWVIALLRDATGGFRAGWLMHLACVAIVALLYGRMAPASYPGAIRVVPRAT
ncbi:cyanate transporter [Hydrogenophaga sp.]|uniref:cyanate transporter n=1 Tax=Hydrogenophaga sp. TaxID=1904254 RepID=UPI0025BF2979|nr:cyanate transporter [Hydrogenophaga sp.]